jgi:hypothetical protein
LNLLAERKTPMSNTFVPSHGITATKGAYNKHAKLPEGSAALAPPILEARVKEWRF